MITKDDLKRELLRRKDTSKNELLKNKGLLDFFNSIDKPLTYAYIIPKNTKNTYIAVDKAGITPFFLAQVAKKYSMNEFRVKSSSLDNYCLSTYTQTRSYTLYDPQRLLSLWDDKGIVIFELYQDNECEDWERSSLSYWYPKNDESYLYISAEYPVLSNHYMGFKLVSDSEYFYRSIKDYKLYLFNLITSDFSSTIKDFGAIDVYVNKEHTDDLSMEITENAHILILPAGEKKYRRHIKVYENGNITETYNFLP